MNIRILQLPHLYRIRVAHVEFPQVAVVAGVDEIRGVIAINVDDSLGKMIE